MNILYEDAALVVLDKPPDFPAKRACPQPAAAVGPAGCLCRRGAPVGHGCVRPDGVCQTPGAAAALSRQITQSQNAYAVQDGRAERKPEVPQFIKRYRAVIAGGPDEALPAEGTCGTGCSRTAAGAGYSL